MQIRSTQFVIIGAGIHGLSTAYHLAKRLKASGAGTGADITVVDKENIAAGASGIACGVIRNNYFQPAMRALMAHSVSIWEQHTEILHYHPVGYMQISPESMHEDVAQIAKEQADIGYPSQLIEGSEDCMSYMRGLFSDWRAEGITSVLHETSGGYANNAAAIKGLAALAEAEGVRIQYPVTVEGFEKDQTGTVTGVVTDQGTIHCEQVIIGAGPWAKQMWDLLQLPKTISIQDAHGNTHSDVPMWTYWSLQEGTLGVDPEFLKTDAGDQPPVIHVDSNAPLYSTSDGRLITDAMWGIYYKPDFNFGGIQGGAAPFEIDTDPDAVRVDPYGPKSPEFIVGKEFAEMWVSALSHCQTRFEGMVPQFKQEPSGGIGAFTPDNFPVFDRFCENVTFLADSNHGYKMIGVGQLIADELLTGQRSELIEPFRFSRFEEGALHPTSNSPFPWS
jgi:glycine/D-amino acid oxidase-like deaminating enzyme